MRGIADCGFRIADLENFNPQSAILNPQSDTRFLLAKPTPTGIPERATSGALSGSPMDVNLLEQIVKLMAANDLSGIELQDGDKKVVLHRGGGLMQMPAGAE